MSHAKNEALAYRFLEECSKEGLSKEDLQRVLEILHWEIVGKQDGSTYLGVPGKMNIFSESLSPAAFGLPQFSDSNK